MNAVIFASGGAETETPSLLLPPHYEIFWASIVFLLIWLAIGKFLPKIYAILDEHQAQIEAGLGAADAAKEAAAVAARERRDLLQEANEQARATRERADQDALRIVAEAREKALVEAAQIAAAASKQLSAERQAAELSLRHQVGGLATDLAERIIGEQLMDSALSARVIDRFMDDLEADLEQRSQTTGVNS